MLRDRLLAKQSELDLTDREFATKLGVSRSMWQQIRSGHKRVGPRIAKAALRVFPEMANEIVSFLLSDATPRTATDTARKSA